MKMTAACVAFIFEHSYICWVSIAEDMGAHFNSCTLFRMCAFKILKQEKGILALYLKQWLWPPTDTEWLSVETPLEVILSNHPA